MIVITIYQSLPDVSVPLITTVMKMVIVCLKISVEPLKANLQNGHHGALALKRVEADQLPELEYVEAAVSAMDLNQKLKTKFVASKNVLKRRSVLTYLLIVKIGDPQNGQRS